MGYIIIVLVVVAGYVAYWYFKKGKKKKEVIGEMIEKTEKYEKIISDGADKMFNLLKNHFSKTGSYIFIGPPKSGKTVFFVTMADRLLRLQIELGEKAPYKLHYGTLDTSSFVTHSIEEMSKSEWPIKTKCGDKYEIHVEKIGIIPMNEGTLTFHDFSGEAFMLAFAGPKSKDASSQYADEAKVLEKEIDEAKGIFLVLDSAILHDEMSEEILERLFSLSDHLDKSGVNKKMAVIFAQSDVFGTDVPFDPNEKFKKDYPDAYLKFEKLDTNYFYVTACADSKLSKGKYVPPENYDTTHARNVVEAAFWMLEIKDKSLLQPTQEPIK